jgi:hypothetical protein
LATARDRHLVRGSKAPEDVLSEDDDDSLSPTSLAEDHPFLPGGVTSSHDGAITNARKSYDGVARVVIGVDDTRSWGRVVAHVAKDTVAETKSEHDATVTDGDVRFTVAIDAVGVVTDFSLVDEGEQIHAHKFGASHESSRCCTRLK